MSTDRDGDDCHALSTLTTQAHTLLATSSAADLGVVVPPAELAISISSLLAMPVGNLAIMAWDQQRRVRAACEQTRQHPGRREVLRLLYIVSSTQRPTIDLEAGPVNITLLTLTLRVDLTVNATNLLVEEGRIVEVHAGAVSASASLSAGNVVLAQRQTPRIDLGLGRSRVA